MILDKKETDVVGSISNTSKKASISQDDLHKLWAMVENPYKNSVGSIVREYTSNCFDSHAEAGVKDAVIIRFNKDETGYSISFIDVGVGLSPERIDTVFLNIFKSTKEMTNDAIGAFGMGSKSGLSYASAFFITTHFDGTTYEYMYRKGQLEPQLDTIHTYTEKRRNGTEIRIPIKSEQDLYKFVEECNYQLYYFENIVFDYKAIQKHIYNFDYNYEPYLYNDYKLYKGKHFILRLNNTTKNCKTVKKEIHLVNGPVKYPIDFNNIKVPSEIKSLNIGLRFDIGELDIIQTREDVRYTDATVKKIQEKFDLVKKELQELYDKQTKGVDKNIIKYIEYVQNPSKLNIGSGDYKFSINIGQLVTPVKGNFMNYKGISVSSWYLKLLSGIEYRHNLSNSNGAIRRNPNNYGWARSNLFSHFNEASTLSLITKEEKFSVKKNKDIFLNKYKKEDYKNLGIYVDKREDRSLRWFMRELSLKFVDKSDWRNVINEFIKHEETLIKHLIKNKKLVEYDKLTLDKKWYSVYIKEQNKNRVKKTRDTTKMSVMLREHDVWNTRNMTISQINKLKGLIICTEKDDKDNLLKFKSYRTTINYPLAKIAVAPSNYKKLQKEFKDKKNFYTWKEFMDNKNNIKFKVLKELYVVNNVLADEDLKALCLDGSYNQGKFAEVFSVIFPNLGPDYKEISKIVSKYPHYTDNGFLESFNADIKELDKYIGLNEYKLLKSLDNIKDFYYYFGHLFQKEKTTYGSKTPYAASNLNELSLYLYYYKPSGTHLIPNKLLLKTIKKKEYDTLLASFGTEKDYKLKLMSLFMLNRYEIDNKLKLTKIK